jgi:hypothetical protein
MKTGKVPKGKSVPFATGGKRSILGKGTRTETAFPASMQKPGRTGQALDEVGAKAQQRQGEVGRSR